LKQSLNREWLFYYIDYDELKTALRVHHHWDEQSEQSFVEQLEKELDKVYTFQRVKAEEIIRRIASSEKEVSEAVRRVQEDAGDAAEEDFDLLEEDLSDIIADVHDLAKFTQLNYTGFQKIIKKHDVRIELTRHAAMLIGDRKIPAGSSSPSSRPGSRASLSFRTTTTRMSLSCRASTTLSARAAIPSRATRRPAASSRTLCARPQSTGCTRITSWS
jgi:hypothetical protein